MAGSVQEGDRAALHIHLIGADVLGDAARLSGDHVGVADIVQQGGLAVVHVAHDHHHGGAGLQILLLVLRGVDQLLLDGDHHLLLHLAAHLLGDDGGGVKVDDVAEGGHDPVLDEALDHLRAGLLHPAGQLTHSDLIGDQHLHRCLLGDLQLETAQALLLLLLALVARPLLAAALALGVASLELLLAAPVLLTLVGEGLQPLVVLLQVDGSALAGVHHLLLRHAGGGAGLGLLRLAPLSAGLLPALVGLGRSALWPALPLGSRLGGALLWLGWLRLGRLGLMVDVRKNGLYVLHLVVLGQIVENNGQLPLLQDLHVVLGGLAVFGHDLRDVLGIQLEVLGHLVDTVFVHHIGPPRFLGFPGRVPAAGSGLRSQLPPARPRFPGECSGRSPRPGLRPARPSA